MHGSFCHGMSAHGTAANLNVYSKRVKGRAAAASGTSDNAHATL
jgi:hypothetical protein